MLEALFDAMDLDDAEVPSDADARNRSQDEVEASGNETGERRSRRPPSSALSRRAFTPAQVLDLCSALVRKDAEAFFAQNYEAVLVSWVALLRNTSFVGNTSSCDPRIVVALKTLDRVVTGREGTQLLARLAYVHLMRLFEHLEKMIATDRRNRVVHREIGYGNASIALDIYMSAQDGFTDATSQRRELIERKRVGRRWRQLAGPSPFFLLVYSDAAEQMMWVACSPRVPAVLKARSKNYSKISDGMLHEAACRLLQEAPSALMEKCISLARVAELMVRSLQDETSGM